MARGTSEGGPLFTGRSCHDRAPDAPVGPCRRFRRRRSSPVRVDSVGHGRRGSSATVVCRRECFDLGMSRKVDVLLRASRFTYRNRVLRSSTEASRTPRGARHADRGGDETSPRRCADGSFSSFVRPGDPDCSYRAETRGARRTGHRAIRQNVFVALGANGSAATEEGEARTQGATRRAAEKLRRHSRIDGGRPSAGLFASVVVSEAPGAAHGCRDARSGTVAVRATRCLRRGPRGCASWARATRAWSATCAAAHRASLRRSRRLPRVRAKGSGERLGDG